VCVLLHLAAATSHPVVNQLAPQRNKPECPRGFFQVVHLSCGYGTRPEAAAAIQQLGGTDCALVSCRQQFTAATYHIHATCLMHTWVVTRPKLARSRVLAVCRTVVYSVCCAGWMHICVLPVHALCVCGASGMMSVFAGCLSYGRQYTLLLLCCCAVAR
jgi:hypothetical protein